MGIFRSVLWLLVGAALAIFLWSNYDQRVVISFTAAFKTIPIPLSAALVGALAVGFLVAVGMSLPNQFRLRGKVRELRRKTEGLESEITELRKLPLSDASEPSADAPASNTSISSKPGA